jgi:exosortase/archaeosortase family protein
MIYHLFLFNGRVIDKPLTDWSTKGAEKIMQVFNPNSTLLVKQDCMQVQEFNYEVTCTDFIFFNGKKIVGIADACNGLELYVLYIGFLFSYPSSSKRIFAFLLTGICLIYIANIIRLVALAYMFKQHMNTVDMAHHYVFKMIVYALIFGLWILFTKNAVSNKN